MIKSIFEFLFIDKFLAIFYYFYTHTHRAAGPGLVKEDFEVTPIMSTYLVAFIVSDLVNTNVSKGIQQTAQFPEINIWTRREVADMTK